MFLDLVDFLRYGYLPPPDRGGAYTEGSDDPGQSVAEDKVREAVTRFLLQVRASRDSG